MDCHIAGNVRRTAERAERALQALMDDPFDDVVITPAARSYLRAFDVFLRARRDMLPRQEKVAAEARAEALKHLHMQTFCLVHPA